jgi:hypothetical protein
MPTQNNLKSSFCPKIHLFIFSFSFGNRAYEAAKEDESSDDDSDENEDEDADGNILSSDEDEIDEDSAVYLESLQDKLTKHVNGNISVSWCCSTISSLSNKTENHWAVNTALTTYSYVLVVHTLRVAENEI